MTEYLIAFNGEWVPDHTVEDLGCRWSSVPGRSRCSRGRPGCVTFSHLMQPRTRRACPPVPSGG
jgi:hypothetical protein